VLLAVHYPYQRKVKILYSLNLLTIGMKAKLALVMLLLMTFSLLLPLLQAQPQGPWVDEVDFFAERGIPLKSWTC